MYDRTIQTCIAKINSVCHFVLIYSSNNWTSNSVWLEKINRTKSIFAHLSKHIMSSNILENIVYFLKILRHKNQVSLKNKKKKYNKKQKKTILA